MRELTAKVPERSSYSSFESYQRRRDGSIDINTLYDEVLKLQQEVKLLKEQIKNGK